MLRGMDDHIAETLLDRHAIASRVRSLATEIATACGDDELVIVPVLTGAIIFLADLVRQLPMRMRIDVMAVSSYPGKCTTSQGPRVLYPLEFQVRGKSVLVIDDILDSGRTLAMAKDILAGQGARCVKTCVLLRKAVAARNCLTADFMGFDIPDAFVVGYGLDFDHYYRNLPDIVTLRQHVAPGAAREPSVLQRPGSIQNGPEGAASFEPASGNMQMPQ